MYTMQDVGCYIDGARDHESIRSMLAELLRDSRVGDSGLIHSLKNGPIPDDLWDEHEAVDLLNFISSEDVYWTWEDGGLCLVPVDENEDDDEGW